MYRVRLAYRHCCVNSGRDTSVPTSFLIEQHALDTDIGVREHG